MENFRHVFGNSQILGLMKKAPEANIGEIWQTLPDARYHHKIIAIKDDADNQAVVFESSDTIFFSSKHPVYVRINYGDLIFKLNARSFVINGKKLACLYPKIARALEKRGIERIPLPEHLETSVVLSPMGIGLQDLNVRLADISKSGIGVFISTLNKDYLVRNVRFRIKSINDIELSKTYMLSIRYVEKPHKGISKAGLSLDQSFDQDIYDIVCNSIFLTTPAPVPERKGS